MTTKQKAQVGESLDITGMVVTGTYSDGSKQVLPVTVSNVSWFNSSWPGMSTLKVTVEGKLTYYTVYYIALSSIAITTPATKLTYPVGDNLDITGMVVTGTYSNGSKQVLPVTEANVSGFNSSAPAASQTLTVTVDGKTTTYTVVIEALPIISGGGGGSSSSTTVTGSVVVGTTGTNVSNITATVTTDSNGNATISMNAAQTVMLK